MKKSVDTIVKALAARKQPVQRFIVAITGAPGAGKSTLADALCDRLNSRPSGHRASDFHMSRKAEADRAFIDRSM